MSSVDKIKKEFNMDILLYLVLGVVLYMCTNYLLIQKTDFNWLAESRVEILAKILVCGSYSVLMFIINKFKSEVKLERLFLIMYLGIGILYVACMPLSTSPDETEHMLRAYGISQGDFIPEIDETGNGGSYIPSNLLYMWNRGGATLGDMYQNIGMKANEDEYFATYSNTALYSPLTYAPQALGILIAKPLNRPYVMAYCGRLFALFTIAIVLYYSIKIIPVGKNILFIAALLPINIYESASLSGTGFTFAMVMLLIAYVLWLKYKVNGEMRVSHKIGLYIILLFVASCKIVYVPFVLLAFAIPMERFGSKKKYLANIICAATMVLIVSAGWLLISSRYLLEYNDGVNSVEQVKYILCNPFEYLQVLLNTIMKEGEWLLKTFLGAYLGYFEVNNSFLAVVFTGISIIYVCIKEKLVFEGADDKYLYPGNNNNGNKKTVLTLYGLIMLCTVVACLLVFTSLYIQWTPVASSSIGGLQGRYYIPFILPIMLCIKKKHMGNSVEETLSVPIVMICFANILTIGTLFVHYI